MLSVSNCLSITLLAVNLQGTTFLIILLVALLLLVFTISGAEVALFSLTARDVNMLKTKQHTAAKRIINLLEERKIVYTSMLIANTFFNICIIILSNFLITEFIPLEKLFSGLGNFAPVLELIVKVLIIAFGLIFFGRIMPKVWATQNNIRFAYGASFVIESLHLLLRRISLRMVTIADSIGRRLGANRSQLKSLKELDEAIDVTSGNDASDEEKKILKGIVKFGNISVRQIMRSRLEINGIDYNNSFLQVKKWIEDLHYSRIPVYKTNLDEITGIINTKDLLPYLDQKDDFDWHSLMRQPYFVPESKLIEDLLKDFQSKHIHFAVVVDEFGGTSGIVTLEDVLEEIIGDIKDEFDEEESPNRKIDDSNYIFEGRTMIHDACRMMQIPADTFDKVRGDSESLAGLVLELAGEFPAENTVIPCGDFEFTVLESDRNRIKQVKVTIKHKG
ncbi:MAG: gliding motility-associated protein GldE [Bacteroidetes bacterium]|nr:gliding motility-associated protein GldE [Bacteroidota bacterium]